MISEAESEIGISDDDMQLQKYHKDILQKSPVETKDMYLKLLFISAMLSHGSNYIFSSLFEMIKKMHDYPLRYKKKKNKAKTF